MRVLNINKFYYMRGGVERYFFALAALLEKKGHEVIPFSIQDDRNFPTPYADYFVSNLEAGKPGLKLLKHAVRPIWSVEARRQLTRLLDDTKPDIAHVHMLYHHLSPSILPLLKERGIPVIMTLHDYKLICPNYLLYTQGAPCKRCKGHKYYNAVTHRCLKDSLAVSAYGALEMSTHKLMQIYEKNVDVMIAPSKFVRDVFVEFGQDTRKIVVVPHFLDPLFLKRAARVPASKPAQPYLFFFGRLAKEKGVEKLLRMLYIHRPDLSLKIAGTGPLEAELRAFVKQKGLAGRVEFLGHLATEELIGRIKGAACVVMPSVFYEPFGLAAIETMALGTPLVAAASGALPDLLHSRLGRLYAPENLKAMSRAIDEVLSWDKRQLEPIARDYIKRNFLPDTHYASLQTIYEHAIASSRQAA
jgi:glycosyltransferase involved in cell wall biosynthesis